nr:MAG TPA: hypothetical protein [Caudoviricetes sp.]
MLLQKAPTECSCKHHSIIKPCFLHWFYFLYSFLGW